MWRAVTDMDDSSGDGARGRWPSRWIVLVGLMGAGKSAVGRVLAERMGRRHVDADAEIEAAAAASIADIFARDGEAFFREREAEVVRRILSGPPGVLSTGGGAWLTASVREAVAASGVSVWLRADLDTLWGRVKGRAHRPLLKAENPRAVLDRLLTAREPVYALADVTVDSHSGRDVTGTAEAVLHALERRPVGA